MGHDRLAAAAEQAQKLVDHAAVNGGARDDSRVRPPAANERNWCAGNKDVGFSHCSCKRRPREMPTRIIHAHEVLAEATLLFVVAVGGVIGIAEPAYPLKPEQT